MRRLMNLVFVAGLLTLHCDSFAVAQSTSDPRASSGIAGNEQVERIMREFAPRGVQSDGSQPTPPDAALKSFTLTEGLTIDLMASEPDISQPLFISWDSQGRMWVVQYRQYQYPEGLKVVRFDHHLRAVFDKVPAAPPNHVRGKDRITVFEDTDNDGFFDRHEDVITGLNIASSVAIGDGRIWVLNPPYLLAYPDEDGDGRPNGDPVVHLSGFGLQDTHSVANSLMWGPDGWLYAANGSTTGGTVSSENTPGVTFQGQCIWRYHPDTKVFEIYAEGGGNTFSLDIDSKGRVFSGTNGGNTRGWYYPQGSYARKNWGKHGPLTNPYAFGFFEAMRFKGDGRRFPQAFLIYEGGLLDKSRFDGNIIAPNAMQNLVWDSQRLADGSTYRTVDNEYLLECSDRWFRPVYAGVGPDGGVYIADWYDTRLSHVSPTDDWHKESGRVYRIRPAGDKPSHAAGNLAELPEQELLSLFNHENKWVRQRATLELGWRDECSAECTKKLIELIEDRSSLEALWALNLLGQLSTERAQIWLNHEDAHIRRWVIRMLGDRHEGLAEMAQLAHTELDVQVRSQLAASAKRIPAEHGLAIASALLKHSDDMNDLHLPLMIWWAIEGHAQDWDAIQTMVGDLDFWSLPITQKHILGRLMQRYAASGTIEDLERCAHLVGLAPDQASRLKLIQGLNQAYQGRAMPPLPERLQAAWNEYRQSLGMNGVALAIRQGDQAAWRQGLSLLQNNDTDLGLRIEIAAALGEVAHPAAEEALLRLAVGRTTNVPALQRVALRAMASFENDQIAKEIAAGFDRAISAEHSLRATGCRTLASRESWALILLNEINTWRLRPTDVPADVVQRLRTFDKPEIKRAVNQAFGEPAQISSESKVAEIQRLKQMLAGSQQAEGESLANLRSRGQILFSQHCANCHRLFGQGNAIAPALDNYDRQNLDFWLPAIVAPSIEIREGYQSYVIATVDGRVITGMIAAQDPRTVTLRTAENQLIVVSRDDVDQLRALGTSLMPDDLMSKMSDVQIRELFAYLMTPHPETADLGAQ